VFGPVCGRTSPERVSQPAGTGIVGGGGEPPRFAAAAAAAASFFACSAAALAALSAASCAAFASFAACSACCFAASCAAFASLAACSAAALAALSAASCAAFASLAAWSAAAFAALSAASWAAFVAFASVFGAAVVVVVVEVEVEEPAGDEVGVVAVVDAVGATVGAGVVVVGAGVAGVGAAVVGVGSATGFVLRAANDGRCATTGLATGAAPAAAGLGWLRCVTGVRARCSCTRAGCLTAACVVRETTARAGRTASAWTLRAWLPPGSAAATNAVRSAASTPRRKIDAGSGSAIPAAASRGTGSASASASAPRSYTAAEERPPAWVSHVNARRTSLTVRTAVVRQRPPEGGERGPFAAGGHFVKSTLAAMPIPTTQTRRRRPLALARQSRLGAHPAARGVRYRMQPQRRGNAGSAGEQPGVRRRVLVVDDEPAIRTLCRVNLGLSGMEVLEAADGQTAVELARAEAPDLILLDVMLPGETGWDVATALGADARTRDIPVVFLTAMADENDLARGRDHGAVGYVTKPFDPVGLGDIVAVTLDRLARGEREQLRSEITR
jgi:CheY-like chemotaxis protein